MADLEKLQKSLEAEGFAVSRFDTAAQAAGYLGAVLDKKTIGLGRAGTIQGTALAERLGKHNQVLWHWAGSTAQEAAGAQIYLTSVNGAAETGELISIDGTGNRVASGLFGHEKVYRYGRRTKVAPACRSALWRARDIAGHKNAPRLGRRTPCAAKGDRCYDCKSPERICRALVVYWEKPNSMDMEVVLVDEDLGY